MPERDFIMERKVFCARPFEFFEVDAEGDAWVCCQDWIDTPIGNLREHSLMEVWNSPVAQDIRRSILDGSFKYCNKETCPKIVSNSLVEIQNITNPYRKKIVEERPIVLENGPLTLNLGYDNSCNLACRSCRPHIIALTGDKFGAAELIQQRVIAEGLRNAKRAIITGHGDAIASKLFRRLLQDLEAKQFPDLKIDLMTNGLLFTPAIWESFRKAHRAIRSVSISIDAATEETFKINRGNADFRKLLKNLEFIGRLKTDEKLTFFEISFVVQRNNYREMKAFVEMGRRLSCDTVLFQQIINWGCGTYNAEQFREVAVHQKQHPEHEAFVEVLRDPIFADPIVNLGNLSSLRPC
jgi:MoaA/NifB/PqqE/SkfB family radical SAM enzyme